MTAQVEQSDRVVVTPEMLEAMRQGEADRTWLEEHPGVLEPYRGQWVVVHKRQIVAHSLDGRGLAQHGDARTHPGALIFYVPTHEEAEAVRIL
jgi:hypothetical protein